MNVENNTNYRLPLVWIQEIMDELGVNPTIRVHFAEYLENGELNYRQVFDEKGKKFSVEALAYNDNSIDLYLGKWKKGKYHRTSARYIKWVLAHELRHQYHFYNVGNVNYKFYGVPPEKIYRREEIDCTRYATSKVGKPKRDFKKYKTL